MISKLIKWVIKMLVIVVVGTLIGWAIPIIVAAVPLWGAVATVMIMAVLVFKFTVWVIKNSDYV